MVPGVNLLNLPDLSRFRIVTDTEAGDSYLCCIEPECDFEANVDFFALDVIVDIATDHNRRHRDRPSFHRTTHTER